MSHRPRITSRFLMPLIGEPLGLLTSAGTARMGDRATSRLGEGPAMRGTGILAIFVISLSLAVATGGEAVELFFNGPLVSVSGGGAGGADASRLQNSLGMTSLGFNADFFGNGNAVADDFTVPPPGWTITRITVFAYQTDSGLTSSLTDLRLVIFDGPPNLPTSTIIFGDPAVNVLAATSFTNVFRDSQNNPGLDRRPIMRAVGDVNVTLAPGAYWLVWALGGQLVDGPFVPPITIPGQTTTGNGLHLCTCSGFDPALDSGTNAQQGFPFMLEGNLATAPTLAVTTNTTSLRAGDRFTVSAVLTPGSPALFDAFVVFDLPDGSTLSLTPGGFVSGLVPFAGGFTPFPFSGTVLDVNLPQVATGTYGIRAFLAATGTVTPASPPSQVSFTVNP
jgi:hypothetical protein